MTVIAPQGKFRGTDSNGDPLVGGKLYTYTSGTSTPKTTYTDSTGATPNANPVVLDSRGEANVWLADGAYRFDLKNSADVAQWATPIDNIIGDTATGFGANHVSLSANTTITEAHDGAFIVCTGTITLALTAAATLGEGFTFTVLNVGTGVITIDPDGSETINLASTLVLLPNESALVDGSGTVWNAANMRNPMLTTEATVASATTTDLGAATSNVILITGTTTITSFGSSANTARPIFFIRFSGALTLTHNATSLILPGGASITTANGDTATMQWLGSGNWKCLAYNPVAPARSAQLVTATGNFTVPVGTLPTTLFKFTVIGAGAGGGGTNGSTSAGGGGGAGSTAIYLVQGLVAGATCAVTIGTAGTAGADTGGDGGVGGDTTVVVGATTITGKGGFGGKGSTTNQGTLGGAGGAIATNGTINLLGQNGHHGLGTTEKAGGNGGNSPLGQGGIGAAQTAANGSAATGYGAGGGGATGAAKTGGAGTAGVVMVEWS